MRLSQKGEYDDTINEYMKKIPLIGTHQNTIYKTKRKYKTLKKISVTYVQQ